MRTDIWVCRSSISLTLGSFLEFGTVRDDMYANRHYSLSLHSHGGMLPMRIRHRLRRRYGRTITKARG